MTSLRRIAAPLVAVVAIGVLAGCSPFDLAARVGEAVRPSAPTTDAAEALDDDLESIPGVERASARVNDDGVLELTVALEVGSAPASLVGDIVDDVERLVDASPLAELPQIRTMRSLSEWGGHVAAWGVDAWAAESHASELESWVDLLASGQFISSQIDFVDGQLAASIDNYASREGLTITAAREFLESAFPSIDAAERDVDVESIVYTADSTSYNTFVTLRESLLDEGLLDAVGIDVYDDLSFGVFVVPLTTAAGAPGILTAADVERLRGVIAESDAVRDGHEFIDIVVIGEVAESQAL